MAWTSMHFAMGMCGGAAVMAVPCLILRRGWRHIPLAMTLGGCLALIPDAPRLWREDFTSLPFAAALGSKDLEVWLHSIGDLFFFHRSLDAQPKEMALLGLAIIIGLYNLSLIGMLWHNRRSRARRITPLCDVDNAYHLADPPIPEPGHDQAPPDQPDPPHGPVIGRIGTG